MKLQGLSYSESDSGSEHMGQGLTSPARLRNEKRRGALRARGVFCWWVIGLLFDLQGDETGGVTCFDQEEVTFFGLTFLDGVLEVIE